MCFSAASVRLGRRKGTGGGGWEIDLVIVISHVLSKGLGFLGCSRNEGWGGSWSTCKAQQPLSHTFPGHGLDLWLAICLLLHPELWA